MSLARRVQTDFLHAATAPLRLVGFCLGVDSEMRPSESLGEHTARNFDEGQQFGRACTGNLISRPVVYVKSPIRALAARPFTAGACFLALGLVCWRIVGGLRRGRKEPGDEGGG